jgi:hypothetical protein
MPTLQSHPTPNPNSLKFTASEGAFLDRGLAAFRSAGEAEGHPLGEPLFEVEGVIDVLVTPEFVTVTKADGVSWGNVTPEVKAVLQEAVSP